MNVYWPDKGIFCTYVEGFQLCNRIDNNINKRSKDHSLRVNQITICIFLQNGHWVINHLNKVQEYTSFDEERSSKTWVLKFIYFHRNTKWIQVVSLN